jgi:uncharacterized protein
MIFRLPVLAVAGLSLAFWSAAALAQDLPPEPEGHVLDLAGVLDATAEARVERVLAETLAATGVDMEVVTLTDLASQGGGGGDLEAYASQLFQAWNSGTETESNGVLLVVTTDPADARIAIGTGYDQVYNARAARVLGVAVLPAFREGRVPEGIEAGVLLARDQLVVPFLAGAPISATEGFPAPASSLPAFVPYLLAGALVLGGLGYVMLGRARKRKTCPRCGELTLTRTFEVIEAPSGASQGSGIEHQLCKSCGFMDREVYILKGGAGGGYRKTRIK